MSEDQQKPDMTALMLERLIEQFERQHVETMNALHEIARELDRIGMAVGDK